MSHFRIFLSNFQTYIFASLNVLFYLSLARSNQKSIFPYAGMFRYLGPKVYLFGKTQLNILPEMLLNYISDTHFDNGLSLIICGRKKKQYYSGMRIL